MIPLRAFLLLSLALSDPFGRPSLLACSADPPPSDTRAGKTTEELIAQLGSKSFAAREEATRLLMERDEAIPALRKASKSSDREMAGRASQILQELTRRQDRRALERLTALAKNGEVDQVAESLVRRGDWGDHEDATWQVVADLGRKVLDLEKKDFRKVSIKDSERVPFYDFRRYRDFNQPRVVVFPRPVVRESGPDGANRFCLIRGEEVSAVAGGNGGLIVSSGHVRTSRFVSGIILAGGSVEVESVDATVIICDGDVKIADGEFKGRTGLHDCVVIARGSVQCPEHMNNCVIISGGSVHVPERAKKSMTNTVIRENEAVPLGFVKFFDPARVGIQVEAVEGGVKVKTADKDKAFAKAGVRPGDTLLAVGETEVKSPEVFRTLLRRKLAEGGEVPLKVRREKETLDIAVRCQD